MRLVFGLVLLVGLGLAGAAVYLAKDYMGQQQARLAEAEAAKAAIVPTKGVFVVRREMRYGQRLAPEDLRLVRWPEEAIPEGAFTSEEELFPKGTDVLRSILRTMEKDEAVLASKVTGPGEDAGVSSRLSPGMRAFAIRTDATSGVSGFLRPGDRVDVFWTGTAGGRNVTKRILTDIPLIAINQSADEDLNAPIVARTVTVEVSPQHVAALAQAQSSGRLSLSLVGAEDVSGSDELVETDLQSILGIEEEVVVQAPQERKCFVTERTPEGKVQVEISCTN